MTVRKNVGAYPMVELSEVCSFETGKRAKGGATTSGIPSIGGQHIGWNGRVIKDNMKYIPEPFFSSMKRGIIKKEDVLLVKDGATAGKTAYYRGEFDKAAINEHVYLMRAKDNILPLYLFYTLRSSKVQKQIKGLVAGVIGGINLEIKKLRIPLPPLSTQKQIVDKIEEAERELSILEEASNQGEEYVDELESSLLSKSFSFASDSYQDKSAPSEYPIVELGDVCSLETGKRAKGGSTESGVPSIGGEHINNNGEVIQSNMKYVPGIFFNSMKRGILKKGDVLLVKDGTVGKTGYYAGGFDKAAVNEHVYIMRAKDNILPLYLFYLLRSPQVQREIKGLVSGVIPGINLSIAKTNVPLPPIDVQQNIIDKIESARKEISVIRDSMKNSGEGIDELRKSILNKIINL